MAWLGGRWCGHPGWQSPKGGKMGGKMNIWKENVRFADLKKFLFLTQIKGNSVNWFDSLKFLISVRGVFIVISRLGYQKSLAKPTCIFLYVALYDAKILSALLRPVIRWMENCTICGKGMIVLLITIPAHAPRNWQKNPRTSVAEDEVWMGHFTNTISFSFSKCSQ